MRKPTIKIRIVRGKGFKLKNYVVTYKGKEYSHQSKKDALIQYRASMRIYKKRKLKK